MDASPRWDEDVAPVRALRKLAHQGHYGLLGHQRVAGIARIAGAHHVDFVLAYREAQQQLLIGEARAAVFGAKLF